MRIHRAEALERKAVGFACSNRLSSFVLRRRRRGKIGRRGERFTLVGFSGIGRNYGRRATLFGDSAGELFFRERFAVPAHFASNFGEAVALDGTRENRLRAAFRRFRAIERRENCGNIVAIDHLGRKTFGVELLAIRLHVVLVHRGFALAERVDVRDYGQVVELVVASKFGCFPDLSFGHFSIAEQDVNARVALIHAAHRLRDPHQRKVPGRESRWPRRHRECVA